METLKQFITNRKPGYPANAYVSYPGFDDLYVRHGYHNIDGELVDTLDLTNLKASCPGNGAFSNLVDWIFANYPKTVIYVENVLNPRFGDKLIRMGFTKIGERHPFSYFKRGNNGNS